MRKFILLILTVLLALCPTLKAQDEAEPEPMYPGLENTQITLPWEDFQSILNKIREKARPPRKPAPKIQFPEPFIISSAEFELTMGRKQVMITAVFDVTVYRTGWNFIPILSRDLIMGSFESDGAEDTIKTGDQGFELFVKQPGKRKVKAALYQPGDFNKTENRIELPFIDNSVTKKIRVIVPEQGVKITIEPAAHWSIATQPGSTVLDAIPEPGSSPAITWERTPEAAPTAAPVPGTRLKREKPQPKIMADVYSFLMVMENQIDSTATIHYKILNTTVKTLSVRLPAAASVDQVSGPPINNWQEVKDGDNKRIEVRLNSEMTGDVQLMVVYKRDIKTEDTKISPPVVEVLDVSRQRGWIGIDSDQNIEIKVAEYNGLAPVDKTELPGPSNPSGAAFLGFKYLKLPFRFSLDLKRNEKLKTLGSVVDLAGYTSVMLKDGKFLTMCSFEIRNNTQQFLKLNLDPKAEVWSSFVNEKPVKPTRNSEGQLLIPLPREQGTNRAKVEVLYLQERSPMGFWSWGGTRFNAPMPDIPVMLLIWEVYMPVDYDYFRFGGNVPRVLGRPSITQGNVTMMAPKSKKRSSSNDIGFGCASPKRMASISDREYDKKEAPTQQVTRLGDYMNENVVVQEELQMKGYDKRRTSGPQTGQGVLPIQINIPTEGRLYIFQKVMPEPDKEQGIRLSYVGGRWIKYGKMAGIGLLLLLALIYGMGFWKWAPDTRPLARVLYLALALSLWYSYGHPGLFSVTLALCLLALIIRLIFFRGHCAKAAGIVLILGAGIILGAKGAKAAAPGAVTMPWSDYQKLLQALEPAPPPKPQPLSLPFHYLITGAEYKARQYGDSVWFDAGYNIRKYGPDPREIQLFPSNQAVAAMTSSSPDDRLISKDGNYYLILSEAGQRKVQVSFVIKVSLDLLEGGFDLSVPQCPINTFSLSVPDKKIDVELDGAANADTRHEGGGTQFSAVVDAADGNISLAWKRKPEDIRPEERPQPRVEAAVSTRALVTEGLVSYTAVINYAISRAGVDHYTAQLPSDVDIITVTGPNVRDVAIETKAGVQTIYAALSGEVTGNDSLTIQYESVFAEAGAFKFFCPEPRDVSSFSGFIGLGARPELEIKPGDNRDISAIDPSELPPELAGAEPILFAYKYFKQPGALNFKAAKNQAVAVMTSIVNQAQYTAVVLADGRILSSLTFQLETRDRQFFEILLPDKTDVWSVAVNSQPVVASKGENNRVLVPIKKFLAGGDSASKIKIELVTLTNGARMAAGSRQIDFPRVVQVPISSLEVKMYVPKEWKLIRIGGNMGKAQVGDVELLNYSIPSLSQAPGAVSTIHGGRNFVESDELERIQEQQMNAPGIIDEYKQQAEEQPQQQEVWNQLRVTPDYSMAPSILQQGTLPVSVTIPKTGRVIQFKKSMITDTAPTVKFYAYPELVNRIVKYALASILFIIIGLLVYLILAKPLLRFRVIGFLGALLLFVVGIDYLMQPVGDVMALYKSVFVFALCWVLLFSLIHRNKAEKTQHDIRHASRPATPPPVPAPTTPPSVPEAGEPVNPPAQEPSASPAREPSSPPAPPKPSTPPPSAPKPEADEPKT